MGRGQQMSVYDIEKSAGSGLRSMNKRRIVLVFLVTFFLPIVITSTYLYYTAPDAATEAMLFLQGRPFGLSAPSGSLNISSINNNTYVGDRNTTGSLDPKKAEVDTKKAGADKKKAEEDTKKAEADAKKAEADEKKAEADAKKAEADEKKAEADAKKAEADAKKAEADAKKAEADAKIAEADAEIAEADAEIAEADAKREEIDEKEAEVEVDAKTEDVESKELDPSESPTSTNSTTKELPPSIEVKNTTSPIKREACNLVKGSWVHDPRPPQYTNSTCKFIQGHQNCMKNGRKDTGYLYWKWKPDECDLPRIDPQALLTAMRDRSMAFAGDSIARNQFQSLLCVLSQVESPEHVFSAPDDRHNIWLFRKHNFTVSIWWSPYLVHVEDKDIFFASDNSTRTVAFIHVDKLDNAWVDRVPGVDILQISTGQWWFKRGQFVEGGKVLGGHICDGWAECKNEIGFADPYRAAMQTVLRGSLSIPGYTGTTILRSFAPEHFEGGSWNNGGGCVRTEPGGVAMNSLTKWMYDIQMEEFQNVTSSLSGPEKDRIKVLEITNIAQIRGDGHPNAFMKFQPFAKEFKEQVINDCLHWCLPGPIDTWNDLLVESLHDLVYRE